MVPLNGRAPAGGTRLRETPAPWRERRIVQATDISPPLDQKFSPALPSHESVPLQHSLRPNLKISSLSTPRSRTDYRVALLYVHVHVHVYVYVYIVVVYRAWPALRAWASPVAPGAVPLLPRQQSWMGGKQQPRGACVAAGARWAGTVRGAHGTEAPHRVKRGLQPAYEC